MKGPFLLSDGRWMHPGWSPGVVELVPEAFQNVIYVRMDWKDGSFRGPAPAPT